MWEVHTAKKLAKDANGDTRDWLAYVNKAEELEKRRMAEKRRRQREIQKGVDEQSQPTEVAETLVNKSARQYIDPTELLAGFQS